MGLMDVLPGNEQINRKANEVLKIKEEELDIVIQSTYSILICSGKSEIIEEKKKTRFGVWFA